MTNTETTETNLIEAYASAKYSDLAILVSNQDFSKDEIEEVLKSHGLRDYLTGCETLERMGYLKYIPDFELEGVRYGGYYTTPNTILYEIAKENGII